MRVAKPWASGRRPPRRRGGRRKLRFRSRTHGLIAALWGCATLLLLILALSTQLMLSIVATLMSAAITAISVWTGVGSPEPVPDRPAPKPRAPNSRGSAEPKGSSGKPGTVVCTQTGMPVDRCTADHKHVMTKGGVERYRKAYGTQRIGDPYGKRSGMRPTSKPKRQGPPVGEAMRRVS